MNGYKIYLICRKLNGWNSPSIDTYNESKERGYYEMLYNWFIKTLNFSEIEIRNYISVVFNYDKTNFDPYRLMDEKWMDEYIIWKKTKSSKYIYYETIKQSFIFITNFCIKKGISLDKYKSDYALRHVRDKKIDESVAVYLKFFEIKKLNKIQKILLKNFLSQYNIIVVRIKDPELNQLLADLTLEMKKVIEVSASILI